MITGRAGQPTSHGSCTALAAVLPRPQQSPPPCGQHLNFTRRRRRASANQPPCITPVCGGCVACSAMWTAGKWRQTQIELGCASPAALDGSTRCCCAAFRPCHHECHPLNLRSSLLLCVRRTLVFGSIILSSGSEMAPRWTTSLRRARNTGCWRPSRSTGSE